MSTVDDVNDDDADRLGGAGLAGESDASPEEIKALYDTWAAGDYDEDVSGWGYEAPTRVAALVVSQLGIPFGEVLDAGCGTGQAGAALRAAGVATIIGGDFTPRSIEAARAGGYYDEVRHLDLNGPLDFDDDRFDAAVSVGVFSYVADTAATLIELLRIVRPGGVVVFTQRTDLWARRNCDGVIAALVADGRCEAWMSEPSPYLPGHPDFGADIGIIFTVLTVSR